SVIADAVTTPYQAILNAGLEAGDVAVFIGVGGVGAFGVQLAHAMGAHVVAIDVDEARLENMTELGAETVLCSTGDDRAVRNKLRAWAKAEGYRSFGWKIFETSGHPGGQSLAFALLGYDGHIGVVGYTREPVSIRMSNLMAFDATMRGTWGCLPEHYPEVLRYVLRGDVQIKGLVDPRPMSDINDVFGALHRHELKRRPVLIPDFS
ncbi:MAG TPA: 6-hydroxycyclohex-1-ene-1-carbonyl-CoA dehydrogenase, partial [Polyangiaceae bacterium]|nr:6-hydroxycyclohex-1-ene-1-carbonyl-CoA dehydrogenase [Polyangiaceae bacterium]